MIDADESTRRMGRGGRSGLGRRATLVGFVGVLALSSVPVMDASAAAPKVVAAPATFSWTASFPKLPCSWRDNGGYPCPARLDGSLSAHLQGNGWQASVVDAPVGGDFVYVLTSCTWGTGAGHLSVRAEGEHVAGEVHPGGGSADEVSSVLIEFDYSWSLADGRVTLHITDGTVSLLSADGETTQVMDGAVGAGTSSWIPNPDQLDPAACDPWFDGDAPAVDVSMTGTFGLADAF